MKKTLSLLLLQIWGVCALMAQRNEWENPGVLDRGKEAAHPVFMWYENEQDACVDDCSRSPWFHSLNGEWKFAYASDIRHRCADFYRPDLDDKGWNTIEVPSNWEVQGFGEPIIRNIEYVFPANPPFVEVENPVGSYRKRFNVPSGWEGKEVMLHFGSITGYAQVYLNGHKVGMTKASKTPAEFNVTPFLRQGENLLAVQVYRWHDGSYMEDQDFWRLSGIERDVYLQAYPKHTMWDYFVHADLDNAYRHGLFSVEVGLRQFANHGSPELKDMEIRLKDHRGTTVWKQKKLVKNGAEGEKLTFSGRIKNVEKWTAETPALYDCVMTLRYEGGETAVTACKVGFRKIEIKNAKLMVNGTPVYVKGVNRHEHHDTLGHVQNRQLILEDLKQMKRLNINAIRTCHYPNHPDFYKLCDEYGFYVIDEANIETHGMGSVPYFKDTVNHPAYREDWYKAHVDRIDRMVMRDKNHACIIGWSLGNECGNGKVFHDEYKRLKAFDKSRFVQFEQAWEDGNTDVVCLMYPTMGRIVDYSKSGKMRPFIMCEYAHAQGNSNGNLKDLWEVIYDSPNLQGGFIWDFRDQGLKMKATEHDGKDFWAYNGVKGGGRWLERNKSDWNTGTDGILAADGTPKPQAEEVKKVYQYIQFAVKDVEKNLISVKNRHDFTNLEDFDFEWVLYKDGKQHSQGNFEINVAPHAEKEVHLNLPREMAGDADWMVNVYARRKHEGALLPAGTEVAKEQLKWGKSDWFARKRTTKGDLQYEVKDKVLTFKSGNIDGKIDLKSGLMFRYAINGVCPLRQYPEPAFWRAPVDNDFGNKMPQRCGVWRSAHVNRWVEKATVGQKTAEGLPVTVEWMLSDILVPYTMEYLIGNDGSVRVTGKIDLKGKHLPELPRFGMRMELLPPYEHLCYYGRGPQENYIDRNSSAFLGIYEDSVTGQYYPYLRPQETGNKTEVRWLTLTDERGVGLEIQGIQPIAFSALHYAPEDLDPGLTRKLQHTRDLYPQKNIFLHVDLKQRGLGGDNSWGLFPYGKYRLLDKVYSYSFVMNLKQ